MISFIARLFSGAVAGIYLPVIIHDFRIRELGGSAFVAMHQMRDKTYRIAMQPFGIITLVRLPAATVTSG